MSKQKPNKIANDGTTILVLPPKALEDVPPTLANEVRVIGGADSMTLHFYYVDPIRVELHVAGHSLSPSIERKNDVLMIRSEPLAKIALPTTVAMDMVLRVMKTLAEGAPQIEAVVSAFQERMAAISSKGEEETE